ncbi:MAG: protein translocase subunit SecF [Oscillospiraceae bacterium]|jgi:preprotein translocase SecF subunit|nr:protein translocase subunit SecF [Oscillospiraceae bacterium]
MANLSKKAEANRKNGRVNGISEDTKKAKKTAAKTEQADRAAEVRLANDVLHDGVKRFDYVKNVKYFIYAYIAVFVAVIACFAIFGAELAIEFKGGTILTYSYTGEVDGTDFANKASDELQTLDPVKFTEMGRINYTKGETFGDDKQTTISLSFSSNEGLAGDLIPELLAKLQSNYPDNNIKSFGVQDVNPSSGFSFFLKCLAAVALSFVLIIIYISIRFTKIGGLPAALFGLLALFIDIFIVFGVYVFAQFSFSSNFIAAALTILGYSINSTIVIYDRIRENKTLFGEKTDRRTLVNISSSQSLKRTLYTTGTSVMVLIVVVIMSYIYNVPSVMQFALPILAGMVSGFFTSQFISGPLWALWTTRKSVTHKTAEAK